MSVLIAMVLVAVVGWVFARTARRDRTGPAAPPAWPGEKALPPPAVPPSFTAVTAPRLREAAPSGREASAAPRGLAAVTQAQAAALSGDLPRGSYAFSSRPQRRRPDRSARLFARARGPGLCSPKN